MVVHRVADRLVDVAGLSGVSAVAFHGVCSVSPTFGSNQGREVASNERSESGQTSTHDGDLDLNDRPAKERVQALGLIQAPAVSPEHDRTDDGNDGQPEARRLASLTRDRRACQRC